MARKIRTTFLYVSSSIVFLASVYHLLFRHASVSGDPLRLSSFNSQFHILNPRLPPYDDKIRIIHEQDADHNFIIASAAAAGNQPPPNATNGTILLNTTTTSPIIRTSNDNRSLNEEENGLINVDSSILTNITAEDFPYENLIISEENRNSVEFNADGKIQSNTTIIQLPNEDKNRIISINISGTITMSTTNSSSGAARRNNFYLFMSPKPIVSISDVSILFPAWEALVIVSSEDEDDKNYTSYFCLFDTKETSPATFSGILPNPHRKTFTCELPKRARRRLPFRQPILTKTPAEDAKKYDPLLSPAPELLRWNFIAYDLLETDNDVVLFVKGINNRQGINRSPSEFKCLFGDDIVNGVRTSVTSSSQEVFRCQKPDLTALSPMLEKGRPIRASLEISQTNKLVPSIAYYTPQRKIATGDSTKSLLCASTMVYNVAKFLREWVIYHSKIGVDKFILYDNGSDDDLGEVVNKLNSEGHDVKTHFWLWPKTQEAGFSHASIHAKNSCQWMMYIDIDEFFYSPSWIRSNASLPSKSLLLSFLQQNQNVENPPLGQLMIACYEFGPSNQKKHPSMGVTQGYNCRKKKENRHKSIVLLNAIDESLVNVIHHFELKDGYNVKKLKLETAVVNHYKFQAWPEFKAKFRRRASTYVVDWTQTVNLKSNDRTPGLGPNAIEPKGWAGKFCEVYDNRLRNLTKRWFGRGDLQSQFRMAWEE